jgi:drug/metabolite transporter (DMT)-like permease
MDGTPPFCGAGQETGIRLDGESWSIWDSGEWWMLLAAQSMAIGTVLVRYVTKYVDPVMATGYHMLLGGVPLLLLSAQQESSVLAEKLPLLTGMASIT